MNVIDGAIEVDSLKVSTGDADESNKCRFLYVEKIDQRRGSVKTKTPGPSMLMSCLGEEIVSLLIMIVAFGSITTHNSPLSLIINQSDGSDDALAIISNQVVSSS